MIEQIGKALGEGVALIIFLSLACLGMIVSIISMIFGGDHDSDHDFGGHDVAGGDHGAGGDHSHDGGDDHGIGAWLLYPVMSVRGMSLMVTGFGALGFVTYYLTSKLVFSCVVGTLSGWIFAFVGAFSGQ